MSLVLDASIVVKWVVEEVGSDRASVLRDEGSLIAPSQLVSEVGNALWKAVRRRDLASADALLAFRSVLRPFDVLVPNEQLHERALALSIELNHPIYDCFYLALAERERTTLITADKRLMAASKKIKGVDVRAL